MPRRRHAVADSAVTPRAALSLRCPARPQCGREPKTFQHSATEAVLQMQTTFKLISNPTRRPVALRYETTCDTNTCSSRVTALISTSTAPSTTRSIRCAMSGVFRYVIQPGRSFDPEALRLVFVLRSPPPEACKERTGWSRPGRRIQGRPRWVAVIQRSMASEGVRARLFERSDGRTTGLTLTVRPSVSIVIAPCSSVR
jgi:hypothetical protein